MYLAAVSAIQASVGFDDMEDINEAIKAALHAVEPQLAGALNTSFKAGAAKATYYVREPAVTDGALYKTEFWLPHGFITEIEITGGAEDPDSYDLDEERGIIKDLVTNYSRQLVKVSYEYGFPVDGTDANSYDLSVVPSWLQEAAKLQAMIHLASAPPIINAAITIDVPTLTVQVQNIMHTKQRYAPLAILPQ